MDQVILIKHGLQKGLEIDEIELGIFCTMKKYKSIFTSNLYLSYQMRTKQEIEDFYEKEVGQAIISEVVSKLLHDRYINDKEYAFYIRERKVM